MKTKSTNFVVNNILGMGDYIYLVNEIVSGYFGEMGEYQPHIGLLNVMRIYYNVCVKESVFDDVIPHDIIELGDLQPIIDDSDFRKVFADAIENNSDSYALTFGNMYRAAKEIIEQKNYSIKSGIDVIMQAIIDLADRINPAFSEDTLNQLSTIAKEIDNGNLSPNALWEAYSKSEAFKQVLDRADKRAGNVIKMNKKIKK